MRVKDVIGKRIVKVNQSRWHDSEYGWLKSIDSIELDNGKVIVFHAEESENEPFASCSVVKRTTPTKATN